MGARSLARHFFQGFFRLSFLDDAGEESFRRVIIGVLAGFLAFGLWLPRLFSQKYFYLIAHGNIDSLSCCSAGRFSADACWTIRPSPCYVALLHLAVSN